MVFGSDWPVVTLSPLEGIYAAVTRRIIDGKNPEGWFAGQKLSVSEALRAYTIQAARELGEQKNRGSLRSGKLADLVVLSQDLLSIDPVEIKTTEVVMTLVGGRVVFSALSL
jgi:predicted amidohydrolase YtcJ